MVPKNEHKSVAHDLLVLQRSEPLSPKLAETVQRKGFTIRTCKNLPDILPNLEQIAEPILIVDCGMTSGAHEFVEQLFTLEKVIEYPVIVLGRDVEGLEGKLNQHFGLATTLRQPCSPTDFLEAVRYLSKIYQRGSAQQRATAEPAKAARPREEGPKFVTEWVPTAEAVEVDTLPLEAAHKIYSESASIPSLVFKELSRFNLFEKSLGGESYPHMSEMDTTEVTSMMPDNFGAKEAFQGLSRELSPWAINHISRTAMIASRITSPFVYDAEFKDALFLAALLFSFSFDRKDITLLRKDYMEKSKASYRKDLCSLVKDSALQLNTVLSLPDASNIVAALGRLVGREIQASDEPTNVAGSAVMTAEYVDRLCYNSGTWNPRTAYTIVRKIKAGKLRDFHPAVLCCMVKFLSEAISSSPPAYLLNKAIRNNPALIEAAKKHAEMEVSEEEQKVPLSSLAPGMKLSRPLVAFDGRQILSEDLILDQDLIWRIWQLSALRPLNAPVIVNKKK